MVTPSATSKLRAVWTLPSGSAKFYVDVEVDQLLFPDGAEDYDVKGLRTVVDAYLEKRPEVRKQYESYTELDRHMRAPTALENIADTFELGPVPPPDEIKNYQSPGTERSDLIESVFAGGGG